MPARNIYHNAVVTALIADGWTITDDPLTLSYGGRDVFVDLGAERVTIGAERGAERIAVEVQSFLSPSPIRDLEQAVGQYGIYRAILQQSSEQRGLYLAIPQSTFDGVFSEKFGQMIVSVLQVKLLVFDDQQQRIVQWIN